LRKEEIEDEERGNIEYRIQERGVRSRKREYRI